MSTIPAAQLRAFVERVERIEEEISNLNADKSEIYKEARALGYDVKALRKVVAQRKLDPSERQERDAIFDLYWSAIHGVEDDAPRARAHAREIIEEFPPHDPETGEVVEEGSEKPNQVRGEFVASPAQERLVLPANAPAGSASDEIPSVLSKAGGL